MNRNSYESSVVRDPKYPGWRRASALLSLGGFASSWATTYPLTTYFYPVRIADGQLIRLDTQERVRDFYEHGKVTPA
jgi:hypothetical protein